MTKQLKTPPLSLEPEMIERPANIVGFLNSQFPVNERNTLIKKTAQRVCIRFKLRYKSTTDPNAPHYIYLRIRVNGIAARSDVATGIYIIGRHDWDGKRQRIRGYSKEVEIKNNTLSEIECNLREMFSDLEKAGVKVTAEMMKKLYFQKQNPEEAERMMLTKYFESFNQHHRKKISKDTFDSYKVRYNRVVEYLEHKRQKYVTIYQIDAKWALEFYDYLTTDKRYSLDTSRRTIKVISMILDFAIIKGDLAQNPLKALRFAREKPKKIIYLNETEIAKLETCPYFDDRLQAVVDCFLFQIHTGLAYSDLLQFKPEKHITTDEDGTQWILIDRQKTGTYCQIPITRKAQDLLKKYDNNLPIITNQRMNEYLKEAAVIAGISTELSTHVGRRTAGTYFLNRGVPMEIVSKILGHKSIKVTEAHYAHLLTKTVKDAFRNRGLL